MSGVETRADFQYVRVGPHTIRTSVRGGDGRPLVLVNGLGAGIETWTHLRAALGSQSTIAVDLPGTGGSSTMAWPVTMRELARIVLDAAAQVVSEGELDVLGYSFGGAVAQEMARLAPERVSRMVLAATNIGWGSPPGDPLAMLSAVTTGASVTPRCAPFGYWCQLMAMWSWSSSSWISQLRQPTLVLAGAHDRVVPPAATRMLAGALPNAELATVDGGHTFLFGNGAHASAGRITEFLARDQLPVTPAAVSVGWLT